MTLEQTKQVDASAYRFAKYMHTDRWASYFYQLRELFALAPQSVLEVGVGDGVVGEYLRRMHITYTCVDIAEDVHPDVVAPITEMPLPDASYDITCAFEVLEHLPFEMFDAGIAELARVSKKHVLISLPHFGPSVRLEFKAPLLPRVRFAWKVPYPKKHAFNGQHHWEIGKHGYPPKRIREKLSKYFVIKKEFVPFENQYHHFFVLEKRA